MMDTPERPERDERIVERRSASNVIHLTTEAAGALSPLAAVWLHDKLSSGNKQPKESPASPEHKPEPPSE